MKSITIRGLPDEVAKRVVERATRKGTSLNRTVIEMLSEAGTEKKRRTFHDLDHLAGSWSEQESDEFKEFLNAQRLIDAELWP